MGLLGDMIVRIKTDTGQLVTGLKSTDAQVRKFTRFLMSGAGIGGAILIFKQLGKAVTDVVKLVGEQEEAEGRLRSAIRATGREASISVASIAGLANALQQTTIYGDEATLTAAAMLQQLANLDEKGLKTLIPRVQNFASAMGVDLQTAASLVGKTLGSSTNALSRYGLQVDMSGSKSQKLESLIGSLDGKFAGMAVTLGTTTTGQLTILQNKFSDLKQELAFELLPVINKVLGAANWMIDDMKAFNKIKPWFGGSGSSLGKFSEAISTYEKAEETLSNLQAALAVELRKKHPQSWVAKELNDWITMTQQAMPWLEKAKKKAAAIVTPPSPIGAGASIESGPDWMAPAMEGTASGASRAAAQYQYQLIVDRAKKAADAEKEAANQRVAAIIDEVQRKKAAWDEEALERQAIENALYVSGEDRRKQEEEAEKEHQEKISEYRQMAAHTATILLSSMQAIMNAYYTGQLANEDLTDKERKKIQRQQAKSTKTIGVFEAIINTASAVAEALPNIPLSILAGIAGAAQIAAIAAQPLPKLARGGKISRPSVVVAGEGGPEWVIPELKLDELGGRIAAAMANATITNTFTDERPIQMGVFLDGRQLDAHIQRAISNRRIIVAKESVA